MSAVAALSDFLLARIAEDEAVAREAEPGNTSGAVHVYAARNINYDDGPLGITGDVIVTPARLLADIEAKRRIMGYAALIAGDPTLPSSHIARHVLADLATVYADHPDFREEWRA